MIKQLIKLLATNKIPLTNALKQSSIIFNHCNDAELGQFLSQELQGFNVGNTVPDYRMVYSQPKGRYINGMTGEIRVLPFAVHTKDKELNKSMHNRKIHSSIPEIESWIAQDEKGEKNGELMELYSPELLSIQRQTSRQPHPWALESAYWPIEISSLKLIVSRTHDQLLQLLLRISKEQPNLDQELAYMNQNEKDQINYQTTINGDIVGSNFGIGDKQTQQGIAINNNANIEQLIAKIIELGFAPDDANELQVLHDEQQSMGKSIKGKVFEWTGKMATKALEKGIESQIPKLLALISGLFH